MKLRSILVLALMLACAPAFAQVTPGTSPLSIAKGGTAGATASAARANLGVPTGTSGAVLGFLNTANTWSATQTFPSPVFTGTVSGAGTIPSSVLANTTVTATAYGGSTSIPSFTVNAQGQLTAAAGNAVVAPAGTLSGTTLNPTVATSSLTSVGTLTVGAIGAGFTAIPNSALANSSTTVNSTVCTLGSSCTITASAIVPAGVDQNILDAQTANYTVATTDCGNRIQAGTGATGQFTVTLPAVAGFAATCRVSVLNGDTGRGKKLSGFPTGAPAILYPKQEINVAIVNGAWAVIMQPGRWAFTANTTVFFDPTNGNDANDCLAAGAGNACLTLQNAWNVAAQQFDLKGFTITFQSVASATYTNAGLVALSAMAGQQDPSKIIIDGAGSTTTQTTGGYSFQTDKVLSNPTNILGIQFTLQNWTITASSGGGISSNGGTINLQVGMNFGTVTSAHMRAVGGSGIFALQNYTISGGAALHADAESASYILADNLTITCTGSPAFASGFASGTWFGQAYFIADTFTGCGTATGPKFSAANGGIVITEGLLTVLPGNSAGTVTAGGIYHGSNAANTIAPEVEGVWTPTIIASTSGSWTPSLQVGSYEKNGRQVTVRFTVNASASSSPVGNIQISGLPFTSVNIPNDNGACSFWQQNGMTNSASYTTFTGFIAPNTSVIQVVESGSGVNSQVAAAARANTTPDFSGMCTYRAF